MVWWGLLVIAVIFVLFVRWESRYDDNPDLEDPEDQVKRSKGELPHGYFGKDKR
ncbi:hypothetical protein LCGC14_0329950 [marine sediment metagenome]|uniref:Uncharacterized protein n=1 Tax=marine sediment metagenome TaxID=412755 RepID=A0A0F9TZH5_9ZZZZ